MSIILHILATALATASPVQIPTVGGVAACTAPIDVATVVEGVQVMDIAVAGDFAALSIRDAVTGGRMTVYYDALSERAARSRAGCLGLQLRLLAPLIPDPRPDVVWFATVFTTDPDYVPPRNAGETRWTVPVASDGALDAAGEKRISSTMPHEQVHSSQRRNGAVTPRWFHEGHATWVGLKVTAAIRPDLAEDEIAGYEDALTQATSLALAKWGGISVSREAILRQVSAEDRARMETDPDYSPPGPFAFSPDDFVSDESNMTARYGGAWKVFTGLEARHGAEQVRAWAADIMARSDRVSTEDIVAIAQSRFGEDITSLLH